MGATWRAMKSGDMLVGPYHSSFDNLAPRRILLIRFSDDGVAGQIMLEDGAVEWWDASVLHSYWKVME